MNKILQFGLFLFLSLFMVACGSSNNLSRSALTERESFVGRTGVVGVVSYRGPSDCEGHIWLEKDKKVETISFHPNEMFGAYLEPGKHRVNRVHYACRTDYRDHYTVQGFETDLRDVYFNVPQNGFCKTYMSAENSFSIGTNESELKSYAQNIPTFLGVGSGSLGINLSEMPYCNLSGDNFYPTMSQKKRASNIGAIETFEDKKDHLEWINTNDEQSGGNSTSKIARSRSFDGNSSISFSFELKSGADAPHVGLGAFGGELQKLGQCRILSFDYKGAENTFFVVASVGGSSYFTEPIKLAMASEWKTVEVPLSIVKIKSMAEENRGRKAYSSRNDMQRVSVDLFRQHITGLGWRISDYPGTNGELYIDNVYCH